MNRDDIIRMAREASFRCGPNEVYVGGYNSTEDLIRFANLVAALAQYESEPVLRRTDYEAAFYQDWNEGKVRRVSDGKRMVPEREWVGLTDDERDEILGSRNTAWEKLLAKAIEAKLKEKNT